MSKKWWYYAGIRAIKTMCQTAVATIGTAVVMSEVNWLAVGSASVLAGILSLLTSLAGLPEVVEDYGIQDRFNSDDFDELLGTGVVENVYDQNDETE